MRRTTCALLALALMAGAGQVEAQDQDDRSWWRPAVLSLAQELAVTAGDDWWWKDDGARDRRTGDRWEQQRSDDRWDDDRYRDRYESARNGRRGNGPPFCRNGSGHPVHGMEWCRRKGWTGSNGAWNRVGWEDVIFGRPAPTRDRYVRQPTLGDILGDVVLGRLARHGQSRGHRGELDGRWIPTRGGSILQLRMGGVPLAELTDANRDGRVDVVLLGGGR